MLTVIGLVSTTFGVSMAGALVPLISVELFVVGLALSGPDLQWWVLALVVAVGQAAGKLLYYYAAQGIRCLPRFLHRKGESSSPGRASRWLERFGRSCAQRPFWAGAALLISAAVSLPPFAASSVVAGWARISVPLFLGAALLGRYVRYAALLLAPTLVSGWL